MGRMRQTWWLIAICLWACIAQMQANDGWTIYASYHNATKAVKADLRLYVLANGNMFSFDTEDKVVELYDKTNGLSDFGLYDIAYSSEAKTMVLLYENGNIDLLSLNGHTWNMSDLKRKNLSDKTLNELTVVGSEALVSTNSGLALIDLNEGYFVDFYIFEDKVTNATIQNGKIYVKTATGVMEGDRKQNLLDQNNWNKVDASTVTFGQTAEEKAAAEALLEQAKDYVPNSPIRNYAYSLNMVDGRLLVAGGNPSQRSQDRVGTVMMYEKGKWTNFDEEAPTAAVPANTYMNITSVVQDPRDPTHHFASSMRSGLYEFKDGKFIHRYSSDNSPITNITPDYQYYYMYDWVTALNYDPQGNLWLMNNVTDTIIRYIRPDGTWGSFFYEEITKHESFKQTFFDKRGWAWIVQWHRYVPRCYSFLFVLNTNGTIDNPKDDKAKKYITFLNQDGVSYSPIHYTSVTEDVDGAIWIGTTDGIFVSYDPTEVFDDDFYFTQVKVPRDDNSGLADYLMNGVSVECIAIDGGNRKWVGTTDNGVYLLSADGLKTLAHFTLENSPLISNEINDIAINGETGEVFIATTKGLCSYYGDATDPASSMSNDNLKVFPNPVREDYQGDVHITGLMYNSNVKIVSVAGKLVAEGTSVGGEFSWDCCHQNGRRVNSGIYYALCTDKDGNKGAVAKILIVR